MVCIKVHLDVKYKYTGKTQLQCTAQIQINKLKCIREANHLKAQNCRIFILYMTEGKVLRKLGSTLSLC